MDSGTIVMSMIHIISTSISKSELSALARETFGTMVKGVVDLEREIIALGGELHADEEAVLLQDGSQQKNLWGVNIYPGKPFEQAIEYDSMINIRPRENNNSRDIKDQKIREKIAAIIRKRVPDL